MVVHFDSVSFRYNEKYILDNVSFSLTDDMKVGIVGLNGSGKSTLLNLILENLTPTKGKIDKTGGIVFSYLPQEPVFTKGQTILEAVMEKSTSKHPIPVFEAKSILNKLGLEDETQKIDKLSGGELRRLSLAVALLSYFDILILDEPTNHLDSELILWLEKYLMKLKKGLILVTHDRYFLQRICNRMLEIDNGKVYLYEANYEKFLAFKAKRMEDELKSYHKLQSVLKKEMEWASKGVEARRTKSKSRLERINQMKEVEGIFQREMSISSMEAYLGKEILDIQNASKSFFEKTLFQDFSFRLQREDIIGIVGENGCGKTTLFKCIMGEEALDSGEISLGQTVSIGYLPQRLMELDDEKRAIDYLKEEKNLVETEEGLISVSKLMEQFLFTDEHKYAKLKALSGGEKRRLELIRVLMKNPNFLILDEPTNDLDIYTIELLEDFLLSFKGPILVVSHDRYFLDKVCNALLVYESGNIKEYIQSYSKFLEEKPLKSKTDSIKGVKPKGNKFPASLRNEYTRLEVEIARIEKELPILKLAKEEAMTDYKKLMEIDTSIRELEEEQDKAITRLLELEELKAEYQN